MDYFNDAYEKLKEIINEVSDWPMLYDFELWRDNLPHVHPIVILCGGENNIIDGDTGAISSAMAKKIFERLRAYEVNSVLSRVTERGVWLPEAGSIARSIVREHLSWPILISVMLSDTLYRNVVYPAGTVASNVLAGSIAEAIDTSAIGAPIGDEPYIQVGLQFDFSGTPYEEVAEEIEGLAEVIAFAIAKFATQ